MIDMFAKAIDDIFSVPEFTKFFVFENRKIVCINNDISQNPEYTAYGYDAGVNFYLSCKKQDYTPVKGDKITYEGVTYKVDDSKLDSYGLCWNIQLKSLTTKG